MARRPLLTFSVIRGRQLSLPSPVWGPRPSTPTEPEVSPSLWQNRHLHMPSTDEAPDVTGLLLAWSNGDQEALDRLIPLVQSELHRLAHRHMSEESKAHALQTTALVNEAYVRLIDGSRIQWQNRAHFFAVSARLMRRILVDSARARKTLKRGGDAVWISLDDAPDISEARSAELMELDDALSALAAFDERKSRMVELRYFGGLSVEETAAVLHVSPITIMRDWSLAKAWLARELRRHDT
ncbi:RNA polymerase sigma factor [Luteitalea pratensis]|uniref:RNA polymerase sigma factor n=1 Tax=Luteitalea pratensis TaxID=1855912 RepID=A0A143PLM3_LUTPR|nr:RNA polymerase sigma factor [Luteitalea pratensis]